MGFIYKRVEEQGILYKDQGVYSWMNWEGCLYMEELEDH